MPYIPQTQREDIHMELIEQGLDFVPENAGELNFIVSTFVNNYLVAKGVRYANINEMMGALECAKHELYSVVAEPYEATKCEENGPVYTAI
jgi:hypothetical protein